MRDAPQSSPPRTPLPASALALLTLLLAAPGAAQAPVRLPQDTRFTKNPGSVPLGTMVRGGEVTPGRTSGRWVEVAIEGWLDSASLSSFNRDSFTTVVRAAGDTLRETPGGRPMARLGAMVGFLRGESRGRWIRVSRRVWIEQKALPPLPPPAPPAAAGTGAGPAERAVVISRTPLAAVPAGATLAEADSGLGVRVLARSEGWARVQLEAWVRDSALRPLSEGVLVGVSQAEVRANPVQYVGQVLEWRLQFVAIQQADELRPEIPLGQRYLLTRGPLPEPGFVYVIVTPAEVARFQALPALREVTVRGRLRAASTKYLPTPVLDLLSVESGLAE